MTNMIMDLVPRMILNDEDDPYRFAATHDVE